MRLIIISIMTVLLIFGVAGAQVLDGVPHFISYQGLLADSGGNPVADGEYVIDFAIWSDSVSISPTDREWISPSCTVLVVNGLFNWQLGSRENLPPWTMTNDVDLWLGIQVESDPEITPRTRLCSAPYAYKAWQADYAEYADSAGIALSDDGDWTVDGGNVYRLTGNVGIGTDNPIEALEVVGNAHVEGNLTWREDTSYVAISAAAFFPYDHGIEYFNFGQILEHLGGSPSGFFHAQVQLPQGAEVDRMTCYWQDSTIDNGQFSLYRSHPIDGSADIMGLAETSGESGNGSSYDDSIDYNLVDNAEYAYFIRARLYENMALYGIVIEYRFTEPY